MSLLAFFAASVDFPALPPLPHHVVDLVGQHKQRHTDACDYQDKLDDGWRVDFALDAHFRGAFHAAVVVRGEKRVQHRQMD